MRTRTPQVLPRGCAALLVLALGVPGCSSSASCTELDCRSEAIVTFPPGLLSGSFDLVIEGGPQSVTLRCLDPSAPETANNPPEITCDGQGFTIDDHPLADRREVEVTVVPTDGSEPTTATVRLEAVDQNTPNGPDCPPLCVIRNGQFQIPAEI